MADKETDNEIEKELRENEIHEFLNEKFDGWKICEIVDFLINSLHYYISSADIAASSKAIIFMEESKYFEHLSNKYSEIHKKNRKEELEKQTQVREIE